MEKKINEIRKVIGSLILLALEIGTLLSVIIIMIASITSLIEMLF